MRFICVKDKKIQLLIILSLIFGALFFSLKILQYKSFFSFEWEDDARHNQVIHNIATSFTPHQTIYQDQEPRFLNDHFHPIYFLIAIFYKIFPHIYTLYFIISFSYGFSSIIVYRLSKLVLKDDKTAFFIALMYLFYPPLHYTTLGAMDALSFALPLIFFVFYYMYARKFYSYVIFMILACLCREDIPLYMFLLGIYQIYRKYPKKYWIVTLLFSGIYFILSIMVVNTFTRIPYLGAESYDYITVETIKNILFRVFHNPQDTIGLIFSWEKLRYFVMTLFPLLFLPLLSLEIYTGLSIMFVEIVYPNGFNNENSYYVALFIPFIFLSLIMTLKKITVHIGEQNVKRLLLVLLGVCLYSNFGRNIIGNTPAESGFFKEPYAEEYDKRFLGVENIFDKKLYTIDDQDKVGWEMVKMVPKSASIMVTGDLLPAVSSRKEVYEFLFNHPKHYDREFKFQEYQHYDVDYILINRKCLMNGLGGHYAWLKSDDIRQEIELLLIKHDYFIKEKRGTYILLKKIDNSK